MEVRVITLRKRAPDPNNIQIYSDIALQLIETLESNSNQPEILRNETLSGNDSVLEDQNIDFVESIFSHYKSNGSTTGTSSLTNINLDRMQTKIYNMPRNTSGYLKERSILNIPSDNMSRNEYLSNSPSAYEILKNNSICNYSLDVDSLFTNKLGLSTTNLIANKRNYSLEKLDEVTTNNSNYLLNKFDSLQSRDALINLDENQNFHLTFDNSNNNYLDSSNLLDDEPILFEKSSISDQYAGLETPLCNSYEFDSNFPKSQMINMDETAVDIFETSKVQIHESDIIKNNRSLINKPSRNNRRYYESKSIEKNCPCKIVPKLVSEIKEHNIPCKSATTVRLNKNQLFMNEIAKKSKYFESNIFKKPLQRTPNRITNYFKKISSTQTGIKAVDTTKFKRRVVNDTSDALKSDDISYSTVESVTPIQINKNYGSSLGVNDTSDGIKSAELHCHNDVSIDLTKSPTDQLNFKSKNCLTVNKKNTESCAQFKHTYWKPSSMSSFEDQNINSENIILPNIPTTTEQKMKSDNVSRQKQKDQSISNFKMKLERFKRVNQFEVLETKIEDIVGVTENIDSETFELNDNVSENTDQKKHKDFIRERSGTTENGIDHGTSNSRKLYTNFNNNKHNVHSKIKFSNYSIDSENLNEKIDRGRNDSNDNYSGSIENKGDMTPKSDCIAFDMIRHEDESVKIHQRNVQFENNRNIDKSYLSIVDIDNKENKSNVEYKFFGKHQSHESELLDKLIKDKDCETSEIIAYDEGDPLKSFSINNEPGVTERKKQTDNVTHFPEKNVDVKKVHGKSSTTTDKPKENLTEVGSADEVKKPFHNKREDSNDSSNLTASIKLKPATKKKLNDGNGIVSLIKIDEAKAALKRKFDSEGSTSIISSDKGKIASKKKRNVNDGSSISTICEKVREIQKLKLDNSGLSNLIKADKLEEKHNDDGSLPSLLLPEKSVTGLNKAGGDDGCVSNLVKSDYVPDDVTDQQVSSQPLTQTKKRMKFFAPLKSKSETNLAESLKIWNGTELDRTNMNVVRDSLNSSKIHEIGFTIIYKEGFCGLNKPLEENTLRKGCTPNGLLFQVIRELSIADHYFFKFNSCSVSSSVEKKFFEFLLGLDCKKVCSDSQSFLLLLLDVLKFEEKRVCYIWDMMDPLVASWLINPDSPPNSFDQLASALKTKVREKSEDLMTFYGQLLTLQSKVMSQLIRKLVELSLYDVYISIEVKITPILSVMESSCLVIDKSRLTEFGRVLSIAIKKLEKSADLAAGRPIRLSSTVDLRTVLYDELKLDQHSGITVGLTYAGKHKSTDQATLKLLEGYHPLPGIILQYRQFQKIKSTYVDGFIQYIKKNLTISTTWDQCSAATGRISSNNPNLQAIPKKSFQIPETSDEVNLRSCFKARDGYTLIGADFHQIELRLFAHLAADETLIRVFNKSTDIFTTLTQMRLGEDTVEVNKEERERTKTLVYAQMYGASTQKVAHILNLDIYQATNIANKILDMLPCLKGFSDRVVKECRREGKLKTLGGRLRLFPSINSSDFTARTYSERQAVNFLIQGSAADICKEAMIRTEHHLKMVNLQTELLLQIHDELVWQVPDSQVEKVIGLVKECMEDNSVYWSNRTNLRVPLTVQIKHGSTWDQL